MIRRLIAGIKAWFRADAQPGTRKTELEELAGGLPARSAAAVLAATSGGAAVLLAPLLQTLAGKRQAARLRAHFEKLEGELKALGDKVEELTDGQFKLVAEIADASRLTVDEEKLELLRIAVRNALRNPAIVSADVEALARLVRDLSVAEIVFMVENFGYSSLRIEKEKPDDEVRASELVIRPGTSMETAASGLIGQGLLYTKGASWDSQLYEWSPLVAKLIALLTRDGSAIGRQAESTAEAASAGE